jgi:hypothetical protein
MEPMDFITTSLALGFLVSSSAVVSVTTFRCDARASGWIVSSSSAPLRVMGAWSVRVARLGRVSWRRFSDRPPFPLACARAGPASLLCSRDVEKR